MPTITRTTHPLPFEHLDPKRFEDLVRQLSYDFRAWQQLEATGRSGSDDGYDVRGWEIIGDQVTSVEEDESDDRSEEAPIVGEVRRWLIRCKREKEIGPTKMGKYFDGIPAEERHDLYGVIFAAAADFSKKTRDVLRERCRSVGIAECHIWGKAEIEDMLYQPKNDGLLFAYFGISLAIRRRSVRTELRSRLRRCHLNLRPG
uniref:hypothetical protein n=1 Tax=Mesorhizobium mediterraneum TaxID=43617 RepID=UPI001AEEC25F